MLLNTFLGSFVFFATNLSLLYSSHLITRRFSPHSPHSVRLVGIGVLYYAFIILLFQALSPFYAITKTWVTIVCLLVALVSHLLWGTHKNFQADIDPIRTWIKDGLASRWACLIVISGFVVLLSFSRALLMPPLAWDCLTYHLTSAALWIKKGTLFIFKAPDQMQNAYFPINGELFASWLLLPFHNDLLVNSMNFPITFLGGLACYAIARELGLNRKEASFAPALICFAPTIYAQITTEYVDNAAFAFCSTSVLFTLRYLRRGYLYDGLLAFAAAGILLGIKYSVIPAAGIIIIATTIKTITLVRYPGFLRKSSLILLGFLIVCIFGGRQYIRNTIEAGNPLYPFPLIVFNKIIEGRGALEAEEEWAIEKKRSLDSDKFNLWEREYRKFCYFSLAAGPKYLLFLILALISLFTRPYHVPKRCWYFLFIMWSIPIIIFFTNTTATIASEGGGDVINTRYFSLYIALFTTQGLVVSQKLFKHFRNLNFVLVAFIAWDLLYINRSHPWEIEVLFPLVALIIPLAIMLSRIVAEKCKVLGSKGKISLIPVSLSIGNGTILKRWSTYVFSFVFLVTGLYFLQSYRDATRYTYYRAHTDFHDFPRTFIDGWAFLDQPNEKKTIALTMAWKPPGTKFFFYPLMGRWLQNDIVYISAKYKWEVPTWLHRGLLGGNDSAIWLQNLKRNKVDYIFVQKPWPAELAWIGIYQDKFQRVFINPHYTIFKYTEKTVSPPFTSSANLCQADVNGDGKVTTQDLAIMKAETGRDDCAQIPCRADVNGDGRVNSKDIRIVYAELGRNCLSRNKDIPESETGTLHPEQDKEFDTGGDKQEVQEKASLYDTEKGEELEQEIAIPASRFKDNRDGTVTDPETNLMWTKNAHLPEDTMLFHQALNYIEEMNRGEYPNYGFTDWRLPTLNELRSLIDYTYYTTEGYMLPFGHPFQNVQPLRLNFPWSPTYLSITDYPLFFSLYCRLVGHNVASCDGYVWPVRGGK